MEPPLYMLSIVEQNIVKWHMTLNVCNTVNNIVFYMFFYFHFYTVQENKTQSQTANYLH